MKVVPMNRTQVLKMLGQIDEAVQQGDLVLAMVLLRAASLVVDSLEQMSPNDRHMQMLSEEFGEPSPTGIAALVGIENVRSH